MVTNPLSWSPVLNVAKKKLEQKQKTELSVINAINRKSFYKIGIWLIKYIPFE